MSKGKIFLIHWNADEAQQYCADLETAGWQVASESEDGARAAQAIKDAQPDAIVIYHTRLPSHGRATAEYLLDASATADIPLIFVDGEGRDLEKTRNRLPQAVYLRADELQDKLQAYARA